MLRRSFVPMLLAVALGIALLGQARNVSSSAQAATSSQSSAAAAATASSLTAKSVAAANAFLKSLSSVQRAKVLYAFNSPAKKTGWSNLPTTMVKRNGVAVKDMSASQVAKLDAVLKTILSAQGYTQQEAIRKADTYLSQQQANGSGGAQNLGYGQGLYYIAIYGTPSASSKWTVQFGGHHLAIHITFSGATVSDTPYFAGVEPSSSFTVNGKTYAPLAAKASALFGAVQALTTTQLAAAKLSQSFDDVLVGPGKDGSFPTRQGVTVSSLSAAQQALVTKAIRAYVADMPTAEANARVALYTSQYSKTSLAWSKSTNSTTSGAYVRIQGPRLWLEIAVQNGIVLSGVHYHSILRDITSDYGA